jgi:hypothetical protein
MVDANLTYLDSLNRYIVLWSYKALTGLSEKRLVSTKPPALQNIPRLYTVGKQELSLCIYLLKEIDWNN